MIRNAATPRRPKPAPEPAAVGAIDADLVALLVAEHERDTMPALARLWDYYRNTLDFDHADDHRAYRSAQERGLPRRLVAHAGEAVRSASVAPGRREVVIENDIAWRVHTLADFMFARPVAIESLAPDRERARVIQAALDAAFDAQGGVCFFQDLALLGSVYGFVDVMLRTDRLPRSGVAAPQPGAEGNRRDPGSLAGQAPSNPFDLEAVRHAASQLVIETVEAPRAIPVLDPCDYRRLVAYVVHYTQQLNAVDHASHLARLVRADGSPRSRRHVRRVTELWTARLVRTWHDGRVVDERTNLLARLPVVHIQNLPQPFFYEGLSEVEPLIPLQDELNTRLSDRANRITMQSFKMYLARGLEGFLDRPVGPGQMWQTDNPEASIAQFGGDGDAPGERDHIEQVRQAMDKASAVTPAAAGLLRAKVGNLSSENALRISLMGLLARTERKRVTYGKGIAALCELILAALDAAGVLATASAERRVRLHWPSPLPEEATQRLEAARIKRDLGVPADRVLAELGYGECESH